MNANLYGRGDSFNDLFVRLQDDGVMRCYRLQTHIPRGGAMFTLFSQEPFIPPVFQGKADGACQPERTEPHSQQKETPSPQKKEMPEGLRRFFQKLGDAFCDALPKMLLLITSVVLKAVFGPQKNRASA